MQEHHQPQAPSTSFENSNLSPELLGVLREIGFTAFTPIQAQAIPLLLEGRDIVGKSKTGSGKTAAFALPILQNIDLKLRAPQALILCPTRELCMQLVREVRRFSRKHHGLHVLIVAGGQMAGPQLEALEKGVHVVIGTPGRVTDFLGRRKLSLRHVSTLVLDEADRMLDMGFRDSIEQILNAAPKERQTVFFSATFPETIGALSRRYQKNPIHISVEVTAEEAPSIDEKFFSVKNDEKTSVLDLLLRDYQPESAIVFCNLKASVAKVKQAIQDQLSVDALHGDLEQWHLTSGFRDRFAA